MAAELGRLLAYVVAVVRREGRGKWRRLGDDIWTLSLAFVATPRQSRLREGKVFERRAHRDAKFQECNIFSLSDIAADFTQEGCGCPNPEASNYNEKEKVEYPGYCILPKEGCTNEEATNYDSEATVDNDTCILPKKGCTDATATNYDKEATVDDESCIFPRAAEVHGGTHANATGHIQSIGGNAVSTLLDGLSAATTIAESASAIIGGSGPSAKANVAAHTRGANTYRLGTAARTRSTTHQNKMHYSTRGTSNTDFDGYAYGKKKDDESTEGAHGADVSLVSPHFSGGYASVGSGYGKDYHAYAGQKESLRTTGYKLPYSIPVEAITNQYYHHYSG